VLRHDIEDVERSAEEGQRQRCSAEYGYTAIESPRLLPIDKAGPSEKGDGEENVGQTREPVYAMSCIDSFGWSSRNWNVPEAKTIDTTGEN